MVEKESPNRKKYKEKKGAEDAIQLHNSADPPADPAPSEIL